MILTCLAKQCKRLLEKLGKNMLSSECTISILRAFTIQLNQIQDTLQNTE